MDVLEGNIWSFFQATAIRVLHKFMGYMLYVERLNTQDTTSVPGSIFLFARLNAFIDIVILRLRFDDTDNVGGHCQKLCSDAFGSFHLLAYDQLIGRTSMFFQDWCPDEL